MRVGRLDTTGSTATLERSTISPDGIVVNNAIVSPSVTGAIGNAQYFQFTALASPGSALSLDRLRFDVARSNVATPAGYAVRTNLDGYASTLSMADVISYEGNGGNDSVLIDLGGATFQGLTGPISLRIYTYAPTAGPVMRYQALTLEGSVQSVPEPPAMLALILCALSALPRRERRGRAESGSGV